MANFMGANCAEHVYSLPKNTLIEINVKTTAVALSMPLL